MLMSTWARARSSLAYLRKATAIVQGAQRHAHKGLGRRAYNLGMRVNCYQVRLQLPPIGEISGTWEPGDISIGKRAAYLLNGVVRPVLTKWHLELQRHEETRAAGVSIVDHEHGRECAAELRADLEASREILGSFAGYVAHISDVPDLIER